MMPSREFNHRERYDAIVVGCGLVGSWAIKELSEAGLSVLALEAGPLPLPPNIAQFGSAMARVRSDLQGRQMIQSQHPHYWLSNPEYFVDDIEHPYGSTPQSPFIWIRGRQVGGRSLTWGGVTLRFSDHEFGTPAADSYGDASWPVCYADLAKYYDKVESFLEVQGSPDSLEQLPDGHLSDPPPFTNAEIDFKRHVEARFTDRKVIICRGIPLDPLPGSDTTDAWPRRSTLKAVLPAALHTRRVCLRPNSLVAHLLFDPNTSLPSGVCCVDRVSKKAFEAFGRVIVLCASTIESVRIMLNSQTVQHSNAVGNSSGVLGRYLMDHRVVSVSGELNSQKTSASYPLGGPHGILIPRFRNLNRRNGDFVGGYGMWGALGRTPHTKDEGGSSWFLHSLLEVLPRTSNRIEIDPNLADAWGIQSARVHLEYCDNEMRLGKDALFAMADMAIVAGLDIKSSGFTLPGQYVHELGGARMGKDHRTSVLNQFNQCWDARNLFLLDGSCFATSGWQNPGLTITALALRACDHIINNFRTSSI